jgi:hypothetical protein
VTNARASTKFKERSAEMSMDALIQKLLFVRVADVEKLEGALK